MKKLFKILSTITLIVFAVALVFSPYKHQKGYSSRSVQHTVEIAAPIDSVYSYLGNSANAGNWSIYLHHITTLNNDAVPDGEVGSLRRCFQNADEQGLRWDEEIILNEPSKRRRLTIFNLIGFPMQAEGLATDQIYEPISANRTRLTFTVFFLSPPSFWTTVKTFIGAWEIQRIFKQNMNNIKTIIESQ